MHFSEIKMKPLISLLFLAIVLHAGPRSQLFWADQIDSAIVHRDSYFSSIGIVTDGFNIISWDAARKRQILDRIDFVPENYNPWYCFVKGSLLAADSSHQRDYFFNRSLTLSRKDPGTTWLLFVEFNRYNMEFWFNRSFDQLEQLLLESGAEGSSLIAHQLQYLASVQEKEGRGNEAQRYYSLLRRISPYQRVSYFSNTNAHIHFFPGKLISELWNNGSTLRKSWLLQLHVVFSVYTWVRLFAFFFIGVIFCVFIIKYFPSALHKQADLFPFDISLTVKTILISVIVCSLSIFGLLPFLWFVAFLLWRFLKGKEKVLFSCTLLLLVVAPLDFYFREMLHQARNPEKPLMLLHRAAREGYSEKAHRSLKQKSKTDPSDYLLFLSAAIYDLKRGKLHSAFENLEKAYAFRPHDQVVLNTMGNYHFLNNDLDSAIFFYTQALGKTGNGEDIRFNLAQCYLKKMETIKGTDLIREAAEIDPKRVNSFIQKNDDFFSNDWPPLRQIIFIDIPPAQFWTSLLPEYHASWKQTRSGWGTTFLGIPPFSSLIISLLLFTLLFIGHSKDSGKRVRRLFECRFCGRVICRKCKSGMLCSSCYEAVQFIRNEKNLEKMHLIIWSRFQVFREVRNSILEMLFPGSAALLGNEKPFILSFLLLVTSCIVYASYVTLFSILARSDYFISRGTALILLILFAYNILFIGIQIVRLVHSVRMFNSDQGISS